MQVRTEQHTQDHDQLTSTPDAGQAALPGGKTDTLLETPIETARREANEEIGLPLPVYPPIPPGVTAAQASPFADPLYSPDTPSLPYPFKIEHLCQLPTNLAKTELGVRPCVAFLHATSPTDRNNRPVDAEATLIPRLAAAEVAAVFSGPFHNFLRIDDELQPGILNKPSGEWYKGQWIEWHEEPFRMHNFYVRTEGQIVTRPRPEKPVKAKDEPLVSRSTLQAPYPPHAAGSTLPYRDRTDPLASLSRFRVFGMTARILVDCARLAYAEEPEFEHNGHFGDEAIIAKLIDVGKLGVERKKGDEFKGDDLKNSLKSNERL